MNNLFVLANIGVDGDDRFNHEVAKSYIKKIMKKL